MCEIVKFPNITNTRKEILKILKVIVFNNKIPSTSMIFNSGNLKEIVEKYTHNDLTFNVVNSGFICCKAKCIKN